jgi:hypothetical protein
MHFFNLQTKAGWFLKVVDIDSCSVNMTMREIIVYFTIITTHTRPARHIMPAQQMAMIACPQPKL